MRIPAIFAIAALVQGAFAAPTIGLNFCDHWENPHISDGTADGFAGWTDSRATGDTTDPAVQNTLLELGSSRVTVTWTSSNIWAAGAEGSNEQALYREYLDDGQTSTGVGVRVTITGLGAWLGANGHSSYQIRCYANNDSANTFLPISVRDGSTTWSPVLQTITPIAKGNGDYPTSGSVGTGESRGYGDSPSALTADIITLTIPPRSGSTRGTLCAFKITAIAPLGPPTATAQAATNVTDTGATLSSTVNASSSSTTVSFEYGLTTAYGSTVAATPAMLSGSAPTAVRAELEKLSSGTSYHFRVAASNDYGTAYGVDQVFTTHDPVFLGGLSVSESTLTPTFSETVTRYAVQVPNSISSIRVTPVGKAAGSTIRVQGVTVASGAASVPIPLAVGNTTIATAVTAPGGSFAKQYVMVVTRLPLTYAFGLEASAPVTAAAFDATGETANLALNFAPATGTNLTVVNCTGSGMIQGTFDNLAQGQRVELEYDSMTYVYLVNYAGGTGNDLVLEWAAQVPPLLPFPLVAGQRNMVSCLENPAVAYDIYLPPNYSRKHGPLPILYTCNPGGNGMVSDFAAVCANLQIITVGLIAPRNNAQWADIYRDFHAVTRDIRQRVLFDPTAEIASGFSGGGWASYDFSRFRPQHVAGVFPMAGWMGRQPGEHQIIDRVQDDLLVARSTGNDDTSAKYFLPYDAQFLGSCGALISNYSFDGGHAVAPDSVKTQALTWILDHRTMPGANDRAEAFALATEWWMRIKAGERQAVLLEATGILMSKPRSWYAYQAQLILDELLSDPSFRSLEMANLAQGDFANNHFYYTAYGAAVNNDPQTYRAAIKALTGITFVTGDRSAGIANLLATFGFPPPVLRISHDTGRLYLSVTKDTPGLSYSLESSTTLPGTNWQQNLDSASETNTLWSAGFDLPPDKPTGFYRIRAAVEPPPVP